MRVAPLLLLAMLLALLAGCAARPVAVRFPLDEGREWTYQGAYSSAQVAKSLKVAAHDHGLKISGAETVGSETFHVGQFVVGGEVFGRMLLRREGDDLYQSGPNGKQLVMKGSLTAGDSWQFAFQGETVTICVEGTEEKKAPLGTYSAVRLAYSISDGNVGRIWLADGVGIVAFEYDNRTEGKTTRLSLGLSASKAGKQP